MIPRKPAVRKKPTALWPYHHWISASCTPEKSGIALDLQQRHRHRQIVDDVQHRDGDDEGEIEPVGDIDVRFLALPERAQEGEQVADPDDGQPDIGIPFRLGIFAATG